MPELRLDSCSSADINGFNQRTVPECKRHPKSLRISQELGSPWVVTGQDPFGFPFPSKAVARMRLFKDTQDPAPSLFSQHKPRLCTTDSQVQI